MIEAIITACWGLPLRNTQTTLTLCGVLRNSPFSSNGDRHNAPHVNIDTGVNIGTNKLTPQEVIAKLEEAVAELAALYQAYGKVPDISTLGGLRILSTKSSPGQCTVMTEKSLKWDNSYRATKVNQSSDIQVIDLDIQPLTNEAFDQLLTQFTERERGALLIESGETTEYLLYRAANENAERDAYEIFVWGGGTTIAATQRGDYVVRVKTKEHSYQRDKNAIALIHQAEGPPLKVKLPAYYRPDSRISVTLSEELPLDREYPQLGHRLYPNEVPWDLKTPPPITLAKLPRFEAWYASPHPKGCKRTMLPIEVYRELTLAIFLTPARPATPGPADRIRRFGCLKCRTGTVEISLHGEHLVTKPVNNPKRFIPPNVWELVNYHILTSGIPDVQPDATSFAIHKTAAQELRQVWKTTINHGR